MTKCPIIWSPSAEQTDASNLARFAAFIRAKTGSAPAINNQDFYLWSIASGSEFWDLLWEFLDIKCSTRPERILVEGPTMQDARWFPGAQLNFAENLLRFRDQQSAIIFRGESTIRSVLTYEQLYLKATSLADKLRSLGVRPGDRVAACLPNMPEAIIGMLATAAIGAVWSSCSPDFGADGIVDRFGQIEPSVLIACDGYFFKGKEIDCTAKIDQALSRLPSVATMIRVHYIKNGNSPSEASRVLSFDDLADSPPATFHFEQVAAQHPLYIMFSSGTTGKPKCIVHGVAGTLIEQRKELEIHSDLKRSDHLFYQTTCGWMMWNWLACGLAAGATLILYDGAPFHEEGRILFRIAEEEQISIFGTNAKFLGLLEKNNVRPGKEFNLEKLRIVLSTGSVLAPESFDYVYREIKKELQLSSISGGTDILGCFALGSPALPVRRGALQSRSFGLAVEVYDAQGTSAIGTQGELVCTRPFPSMPIGFWNDRDGSRYREAYFERFPGVWTHGDFVELLNDGGMVFHGRSDATLNPGGVRIGTAELYHQVEKIDLILESLVVARRSDTDEQIVLFVVMKPGKTLTAECEQEIRALIRQNLTAFHVPQHIIAVRDLPRTRNGKIMELAVRDILAGKTIQNREALANPEVLADFEQIARQIKDR